MPIKLPKAFPRRKSSGNALADSSDTPEPSFRVLERPTSHSFHGPNPLNRRSQARPLSAGQLGSLSFSEGDNNLNISNRGSGGTHNSTSSGGHDNSSSSARFSSSSTLPSSTDIALDERPQPKGPYTMPAPPIPETTGIASLKAAGRAFSFGRKKAEGTLTALRPTVEHVQSDEPTRPGRGRAYTESSYASESTATPPKLLDAGLDFGSTDNFGSMFDNFGQNRSQTELNNANVDFGENEKLGNMPLSDDSFPNHQSTLAPSPFNSPRSVVSHGSHDGLMFDHYPPMERTFSYEGAEEKIDRSHHARKSKTMPMPSPPSPPHLKHRQHPPSDGLRRNSVYAHKIDSARDSTYYHDEDARLVMDSIAASRRLDRSTQGTYHNGNGEGNLAASPAPKSKQSPSTSGILDAQQSSRPYERYTSPGPVLDDKKSRSTSNPWHQSESATTTPRAKKSELAHEEERSMFDSSPPTLSQDVVSMRPKIQPPPKPQTQNKIMTPAQFERYRKQQEMNQSVEQQIHQDSSDEEVDEYDDDDEMERNKQIAKQRRKQEAHLAVYRQQMMKVTGEQPSDLPNINLRQSMERSNVNTPNVPNPASSISINFDQATEDGKTSDDEDEDVPLGVLAAHGFPSKNRPPTALSARDSRIQYKSESYPPPPASTSGASQGDRSAGLPPFAKKLPQDPYFGAGLVNPSNRESLSFAHPNQGSIHGGTSTNMHPSGLVGVIAGEEKARAARRGSPNPHGNYGSPLPPGITQMPGLPPGMPPLMSPGEHATVQMSEQMTKMMQMQMQWMQQMQQMMASGVQFPPGQQPPMMPGQPSMMMPTMMSNPPPQPQRPISSGPHTVPGTPGGYMQGGRAMSIMDPGPTPPWLPQHGNSGQSQTATISGGLGGPGASYAPSIAPSERSNIGMPSRYRPVSIAPADEHKSRAHSRASTMNSNTLYPVEAKRASTLSTSRERTSNLSVRPVSRTPPQKAGSDDDDEEGWEEMKQVREKKKNVWRRNKKKDEQANTGLEYYDYSEV